MPDMSNNLSNNVMNKTLLILYSCILTASTAGAVTHAGNEKRHEGIPDAPRIMRPADGDITAKRSGIPSLLKIPVKTDAAPSVKLIGNVIYSTYTDEGYVHPPGIYSFDAAGDFELIGGEGIVSNAHAAIVDDRFYSLNQEYLNGTYAYTLNVYSTKDWSLQESTQVSHMLSPQANPSYDPATGLSYGSYLDEYGASYEFCSVDYKTLTRTRISSITEHWISSFIDENGILYMIGQNGKLNKVDKQTGELTYIGDTGYPTYYACSATYDPASGKAYWAAFFGYASYLMEIDPATAETTVIGEFSTCDEIMGLMLADSGNPGAPASPDGLVADFANGALDGEIRFVMPVTTSAGDTLEGNLGWTAELNGSPIGDGVAAPGSEVFVNVSAEQSGMARFTVRCSNESGDGPEASLRIYLGTDTPLAPGNVSASWDTSAFTVTWNPVTGSVNDGYVDYEALRYDVYRCPGRIKVGESLDAVECIDSGVDPMVLNLYYYEVVAVSGGMTSKPGVSNKTILGEKVYPPFENDFSSQEAFDLMTTDDCNGDGNTWIWDENTCAARIKYSTELKMDDWLMTPPVHLEAGNTYAYRVGLHSVRDEYPEDFEIRMGTEPKGDAMTTEIVEPTVLASQAVAFYDRFIEVEETGDYYIGIHGISDPDHMYLYVDEFSISAPSSKSAPEGVTDVRVKTYGDDRKDVDISFLAPSSAIDGTPLQQLDRVEVKRDGEVVRVFDNAPVGEALSFTDNVPEALKAYTWTFTAYNAHGAGKDVDVQAYVGINIPGKCGNVRIEESGEPGMVTVVWDAPLTDVEGYPFDPEKCTYTLMDYDGGLMTPIADGLTETSHTYRAIPDGGPQAFKMYAVKAVSSKGEGQASYSDETPVGPAYGLPWSESFANLALSSIFGVNYIQGRPSIMLTAAEPGGVIPQDNDGGFLVIESEKTSDCVRMYTGKIDLGQAASPEFTCYVYNDNSNGVHNQNEISFQISTDLGRSFRELRHIVIGDDCTAEGSWNRVGIDLSEYIGQEVIIGWQCTVITHTTIFMDAFSVAERPDYDLEASRTSAPSYAMPGKEFEISVKVSNIGAKPANGYTVGIFNQNGKVASADGKPLDAMQTETYSFRQTLDVLSDETVSWYAVVEWAEDMNPDNNMSAEATTVLTYPSWPTVDRLACETHDGRNVLTWGEPVISREDPKPFMETFEEGEPFSTTFGAWTFHDGDGAPIGGIEGIEFPIPYLSSQSFWIHDTSYLDGSVFGSDRFKAHSGTKYLASMFRQDDKTVDDWAISPVLSGESQTVSVWAKSYDPQYKESFEILYSDGSLDMASFVAAARFDQISEEWTEYKAELPAGALRFAIRSVGTGAFMFMADDVTYIPESHKNLVLLGYNVYKDKVRLNETPIETTTYTDEAGTATYHVSVVYAQGESRALSATTSGVGMTEADGGPRVYFRDAIVLEGASGRRVAVCTLDGQMVYNGVGHDLMSIPVAPGVYIVRAGNTCVKIMAK